MKIELTSLPHNQANEVKEELSTFSRLSMHREANEYGDDNTAYRFNWGGRCIAYLPNPSTLREYWTNAKYNQNESHASYIKEWGLAVIQVRKFCLQDVANEAGVWMVKVAGIEYSKDEKKIYKLWINWEN